MTHGTVIITDSWEAYYLRRRLIGCICFWIWFVIVIIITSGSLGGSYGSSDDPSDDTNAVPYFYGQTQIVATDAGFLCESVDVGYHSFGTDGSVALYSLAKIPTLGFTSNITFLSQSNVYVSEFQSWKYFLHEGSIISTSVCREGSEPSPSRLLLIRGKNNFDNWKISDSGDEFVARSFTIPDTSTGYCNSDGKSFEYTVPTEQSGVWYFVVDNGEKIDRFSVDILLYSKQYQIKNRYILHKCLGTYNHDCQVAKTKGATYLIAVSDPLAFSYADYTDTVSIAVGCNTNTGILAAIIAGPILVMICCCSVLTVAIACLLVRRRRKNLPTRQSQPRQGATGTASVVTVTQATVVHPQIPSDRVPINPYAPPPAYQPAPGNFQKPPGYQPAPANYGAVQQQY